MVEIIKQGNKNIKDCLDCGSTLKYNSYDIWKGYHEPKSPDEFDSTEYYYIHCPCGSKLNVTSDISVGIKKRIEEIETERKKNSYNI